MCHYVIEEYLRNQQCFTTPSLQEDLRDCYEIYQIQLQIEIESFQATGNLASFRYYYCM